MVDGHCLGQLNHGAFRGAVRRGPAAAGQPPARRQVDDHAATRARHHWDRVLRQQEDRFDVDRHHPVPVLLARLRQRGAPDHTGAVDQDVERAERRHGLVHGTPAL